MYVWPDTLENNMLVYDDTKGEGGWEYEKGQ